jgi:cbb3-type cytochrome oxidase subunit 3
MLEYIFLTSLAVLILCFLYIIFYVYGTSECSANAPNTNETKDASQNIIKPRKQRKVPVIKQDASGGYVTLPYATNTIQSVDDYEYNMVFQNEGDRGMTKATRDSVMSKYPMDWTVQPPSSDLFQQGLASYKESFTNKSQVTPKVNPYKDIDGKNMTPPVYIDEKDILSSYTPKKPNELTTYDAADAKELIDKIYSAKGLVAHYKKTGDNTFTIMSTSPKDEKIVYEDEEPSEGTKAPATMEANPSIGEATYDVPANIENYKTPDPFYTVNPNNRTRDGKWDYSSWTPGLERMFAPTEPKTNWY